ncbi:MAG: hypothetical protein WA484_00680 [Solirubrobacteraceae bacterium]
MDLGFDSAGLAALCNAEQLMVERWGPEMGRTVGKRLLDLAAATVTTIERIPTARAARDRDGQMTITFDGTIVISGQVTTDAEEASTDTDRFVISTISVDEDGRP